MAELKETHVVSTHSASPVTPWLAFLVGALLIGVIALLVMNVHGSVTGPAGRIDFNVKPPATTNPAPQPVPTPKTP